MSNNKFLYSIYKSVKTLNREKMDLHTRNINKLVGGGPNEDFTEIMTNLGLIEENVLNYFDQLKKYIDVINKNNYKVERGKLSDFVAYKIYPP